MTKIIFRTDRSTLFIALTEGEALSQSLHSFPLSDCHFRLASGEKWGKSFALESTSVPGVIHQIAFFHNEHEAVSALHQLNSTLARRRRFNRLTGLMRNLVWPGAFLTAALAGIVSLNGAVMNIGAAGGSAPAMQQQTTLPANATPQQLAQPAAPAGAMLQTPAQVSDDDLASLKAAVKNGRFTVTLSQGHARTLYVFSDPRCPHCRDLEPRLEQLSKMYNVEIFPVSAFGQERSHAITAAVLTADKKSRAEKWAAAFNGGDYQALDEQNQGEQSNGAMLADANDAAFVKFGFIGTPTIVTDEGKTVPVAAVRNDAQLQQYMGNK